MQSIVSSAYQGMVPIWTVRIPSTLESLQPCTMLLVGREERTGTEPSRQLTVLRFTASLVSVLLQVRGSEVRILIRSEFTEDGSTMMVRDCALDSGSLTTDTELVRMSHCGGFHLDNSTHLNYVRGCVQSCHIDGCNHGTKLHQTFFHSTSILFLSLVILTVNN